MAGSSTITGDTTTAGTLQIGSGGTSGSVTGDIVNNANVTFNRSDAHTYSGGNEWNRYCYEISFEHYYT